ncbi:MAG: riboflavin kinase [Roseburia sp.]
MAVETNIFDFNENLYGKKVSVSGAESAAR